MELSFEPPTLTPSFDALGILQEQDSNYTATALPTVLMPKRGLAAKYLISTVTTAHQLGSQALKSALPFPPPQLRRTRRNL